MPYFLHNKVASFSTLSVSSEHTKCTVIFGLPNEIFQICKSCTKTIPFILNNLFLNSSIFKSFGVVSNNISKISFVTGIDTENDIIMNIIDSNGSINIQSFFIYSIIDAITTPIDCIKSPIIWADAAFMFWLSFAYTIERFIFLFFYDGVNRFSDNVLWVL